MLCAILCAKMQCAILLTCHTENKYWLLIKLVPFIEHLQHTQRYTVLYTPEIDLLTFWGHLTIKC